MTKKNRMIYLTIGIVAGLLLTACAGVAAGKADLTAGPGGVLFFGSTVAVAPQPLTFISLDTSENMGLIRLERDLGPAVSAQPQTKPVAEMEPLEVLSALNPLEAVAQAQISAQSQIGHHCHLMP